MNSLDEDDGGPLEDSELSEDPDDSDVDHDELADTEPCPYCGREIYEQAEACPHCGKYISQEGSLRRKPLWFVVSAILCLMLIILFWVMRRRY